MRFPRNILFPLVVDLFLQDGTLKREGASTKYLSAKDKKICVEGAGDIVSSTSSRDDLMRN